MQRAEADVAVNLAGARPDRGDADAFDCDPDNRLVLVIHKSMPDDFYC